MAWVLFRRAQSRHSVFVKCRCYSFFYFSDNIALLFLLLCAFDLFSWFKMLKINRYASKPTNIDDDGNAKISFIEKSLSLLLLFLSYMSLFISQSNDQQIAYMQILSTMTKYIHCVQFCETLDVFHSLQIIQFSIWTRVRAHSWLRQILLLFYAQKY